MTRILQWVTRCRGDEHSNCMSYRNDRFECRRQPSRLLHLDPATPFSVQLVEVGGSERYNYVTLSHRWGSEPNEPLRLSRESTVPGKRVSEQDLKSGIPISHLPKTFRDAAEIVRYCRLEYLWIDSLCIVQDKDSNGDNPDWKEEAGKMGDIYAGGVL